MGIKLNKEQRKLLGYVKHLVDVSLDSDMFTTEGLNPTSPLSNIFEAIGKELLKMDDDNIIVYESNN